MAEETGPTKIGIDEETNAVLVSDDTAIDIFVDGEEMTIDETDGDEGFVTLTGVESSVRATLQFRQQK